MVVASRLGVRSLAGRSKCDACGTQLRSIDLVPLFSYLFLRGRCRACKSRIPVIAFWSELLLGLSFAIHSIASPDILTLVVGLVVISICAVLAIYDARTQFLPANYLWGLLAIAIVYAIAQNVPADAQVVITFLYALIPSAVLWLVVLISREKLMGIGDPLLFLSLSLIVGTWQGALFTLLFASWGGLVYVIYTGLSDYLSNRTVFKTRKIAFGPFLIAGFLIAWWMSLAGMLNFV